MSDFFGLGRKKKQRPYPNSAIANSVMPKAGSSASRVPDMARPRSYGSLAPSTPASIDEGDGAVHPKTTLPANHWRRRGLAVAGVLVLVSVAVLVPASYRRGGLMSVEVSEEGGKLRSSASRSANPLPEGEGSLVAPRALLFRASNEYGEYDKAALEMYGLDMLIEPYRETTIIVVEDAEGRSWSRHSDRFVWRLQHANDEGVTSEAVADAWTFTGGTQATLMLRETGGRYVLSVKSFDESGAAVSEGRIKVSCKYVRREIRDLTELDRELFLDALQVWYTIPNGEGREKYGAGFSNYQSLTAIHNAQVDNFCYHIGLQFLTSHFAFDLAMERYLQMIDPRTSLPIWDFMIDSSLLGYKWYESVIFDEGWFGSAFGSPENDFMLSSEGRFGNISTIYDPPHGAEALASLVYPSAVQPYHDAYGNINAPNNYQNLPRLSRASSHCGLASHATLATAETFIACFEEYANVFDWESCMETNVHGDMHGLLGGAFGCNTDMKAFSEEHPEYSRGLLSFALEYMTFTFWPTNSFIPSGNTCDSRCDGSRRSRSGSRGGGGGRGNGGEKEEGYEKERSAGEEEEACGCTCLIDAFAISDEEVYAYMEDFMASAGAKFHGDEFVDFDDNATFPYGFMQNGERLGDKEGLLLMRYLVKIGCEPGGVGYLSTLASPLDPSFFLMHALFDKALHILQLSPRYESYEFEWVGGPCPGSGFTDELPFSEASLGLGTGEAFMTNERILEVMHPRNPAVPYVYENFAKWGTSGPEDWNPLRAR